MKYQNKVILFLLLFSFSLMGCSAEGLNEPISRSDFYFNTIISVTLYETEDEEVLENCMKMCKQFEQKFSRTIETSEISAINHAKGKPVKVSDETIEIIQKGIEYGKISKGKFDITIGAVSELWDFQPDSDAIVPNEEIIAEKIKTVDYTNIIVNEENGTVQVMNPEAKIDLGGIAKGYVADELKEYIQEKGIEHALINLGGNVLTLGKKTDGTKWHIGVQKPFAPQNETIDVVAVSDKSVVSSGIYERYFKVDEKIYHHILDTETGYPIENELSEVSIISGKSVDGDCLSTTCFALGLTEGMKLIESIEDTEALFVTREGKCYYTSGGNNYYENWIGPDRD